jgi:hypothetical protein
VRTYADACLTYADIYEGGAAERDLGVELATHIRVPLRKRTRGGAHYYTRFVCSKFVCSKFIELITREEILTTRDLCHDIHSPRLFVCRKNH